MGYTVQAYEKQVRALLGRDDEELTDSTIDLDIYSAKALRNTERATGLSLDDTGMDEERMSLFNEIYIYNTALLLIPYCMSNEAQLQQTANAKVQFKAVDWNAMEIGLAAQIQQDLLTLDELNAHSENAMQTHFCLSGRYHTRGR